MPVAARCLPKRGTAVNQPLIGMMYHSRRRLAGRLRHPEGGQDQLGAGVAQPVTGLGQASITTAS